MNRKSAALRAPADIESIELGFPDPITGRKRSLTVKSLTGIPVFVNDYIGVETLATMHTGTARMCTWALG